jgi:hypothetical protein
MSSQYVLQQLATLDISKATGLDNISAIFLKMSSHLISIPFCHDLNENLTAVNKVNCIYLGNSSNDSSYVFQGFLMLMSSQYLLQQLATLDISKATGLDNISAIFLKMSSHLISIPFCHIF